MKKKSGSYGLNQWCFTTNPYVKYEYCQVDICTHDTMEDGGLFKIWMKLILILKEQDIDTKDVWIAAWKARNYYSNRNQKGKYISFMVLDNCPVVQNAWHVDL